MTKKQAVGKAIREACPELMELTRGCEVQHKGTKRTWKYCKPHGWDEGVFFVLTDQFQPQEVVSKEWAIIGHPIQLQHVLRAIHVNGQSICGIDQEGNIEYDIDEHLSEPYNLTLPFSQQDDKVFSFLYKLIVKNDE